MMTTNVLGARVKEAWMAGLPPRPDRRKRISGAYLSLIAVSFSELRKDLTHLIESGWAEPVRRRAEELSSTLAKACEKRELEELGTVARSLANLTRLSRLNAESILLALREKFDELMREATRLLAVQSKSRFGS